MILRTLGSMTVWALVLAVGLGYGLMSDATDEVALKRTEGDDDLVLVSDDNDDDDSNDNTDSAGSSGVNSNDATGSGHSAVSRDQDLSRDDKTRDWTRDGTADRTRDVSANATNDASRNDSRSSQDHTGSGYTAASRDKDVSRQDKTRDFTRDGDGDRTRDFSQNHTNDASRGDTR